MARIRTIKPEFFTSEDIVSLGPWARLLYIALWCDADREGLLQWRPATFKMRYFPADKIDIETVCAELVRRKLVIPYGGSFAVIPMFSRHQHINPRESQSVLPLPPEDLTRADASVTGADASNLDGHAQGGRERKGKEGKGRSANADASADTLRSLIVALPLPPSLTPEKWTQWVDFRQSLPKAKRIGTVEQAQRQLDQLATFHADGHDTSKIVQASLAAGWQGLFPKPETLRSENGAPPGMEWMDRTVIQ